MKRGQWLILIGGVLLVVGLGCSFGSTYYQVKAMGELRKGQLALGPEKGSPEMQEKERQVTYSDCFFYTGLGLTAIGIILQTWGGMLSGPLGQNREEI